MRLAACGCSVIGPAHQQEHRPNQDAVQVRGHRRGGCIAVSDGLGSRPLSQLGARYAVQEIQRLIRQPAAAQWDTVQLCQQLRQRWLQACGDDWPACETTSLWASVDHQGHGSVAQIGDGLVLLRQRGNFTVLTPPRSGFGNQTQTLARHQPEEVIHARFSFSQPGDGVLIMTDGIADDLIPAQLGGFFDTVYQQLKVTGKRRCKRWLQRELTHWSTPKHGDDKTMAGIFRTE